MKNIKINYFWKSVILVAFGSLGGQLIIILSKPILTRLFSVEEFGNFSLYISILSLLMMLGTFQYEKGIIIADEDELSLDILGLSLMILTALTSIIFIVCISMMSFAVWSASPIILILLPFGFFFAGLFNILMQWSLRKKSFKTIGKAKVKQSLLGNLVKISFGLFNFNHAGLIIGSIILHLVGSVCLLKALFVDMRKTVYHFEVDAIKNVAFKYKNFPIYSMPARLLNTAGIQLPVLFMTLVFGLSTVGQFSLANSILSLPMMIIGQSIGDVFLAELSTIGKVNPNKSKRLMTKLVKRLFLIGLIPTLIVVIFGPVLFSMIFGEEWYIAGVFARILSIVTLPRLCFSLTVRVFTVFEKQQSILKLDILRVILVSLGFGISFILGLNIIITLLIYAIMMALVYLVTFLSALRLVNNYKVHQRL